MCIPRLVLTVRRPRTPLVLKSPMEFPCCSLGSPARSPPVHSCGTVFSPLDPVDALDRIFFASFISPVPPGFQARRVPRWLVLITSGPEGQVSGQSSQSEQWSPGQDSLLVNRIFRGSPCTFVRLFTTAALCCSGQMEPRSGYVLSPRSRTLKYQPWSFSG